MTNSLNASCHTDKVPGRVGSVTISASWGVQNEIVASAESFGRGGDEFGHIDERTVAELVPVLKWYRCRFNQ